MLIDPPQVQQHLIFDLLDGKRKGGCQGIVTKRARAAKARVDKHKKGASPGSERAVIRIKGFSIEAEVTRIGELVSKIAAAKS